MGLWRLLWLSCLEIPPWILWRIRENGRGTLFGGTPASQRVVIGHEIHASLLHAVFGFFVPLSKEVLGMFRIRPQGKLEGSMVLGKLVLQCEMGGKSVRSAIEDLPREWNTSVFKRGLTRYFECVIGWLVKSCWTVQWAASSFFWKAQILLRELDDCVRGKWRNVFDPLARWSRIHDLIFLLASFAAQGSKENQG